MVENRYLYKWKFA